MLLLTGPPRRVLCVPQDALVGLGVQNPTDIPDVEDGDLTAMGMKKVEIGRLRRAAAATTSASGASPDSRPASPAPLMPMQPMPPIQAPPTMYQQQTPADGLSAGLLGGPSDAMGLQAPPGYVQQATLQQRAAACCSGGQMLNCTAVFCNVALTSMVLTQQQTTPTALDSVDSAAYSKSDNGWQSSRMIVRGLTCVCARAGHAYLGASLAIVGCCLGTGYGALQGGTIVSVVLSLPIAVMGLIMAVIIIGAVPAGQEGYCAKVGYAHFSSGFAVGGAGLAGGLAIGATGVLNADCVECGATAQCSCM